MEPFDTYRSDLQRFLLQAVLVIFISRVLRKLLNLLTLPGVLGEIIAGIILGPTCMYHAGNFKFEVFGYDPDAPTKSPKSIAIFNFVGALGLLIYMFNVGTQINVDLIRQNWKSSTVLGFTSMFIPVAFGFPFAYIYNREEYTSLSPTRFGLFFGVALSVASLGLLARVVADMGLMGTTFGNRILTTSGYDYITCWVYLAIALTIAIPGTDSMNILYRALFVIADIFYAFVILRPVLVHVTKKIVKRDNVKMSYYLELLMIVFASAYLTEGMYLSNIIGAMQVGIFLPRGKYLKSIHEKSEDILVSIFLPIYFASTGLKSDFQLISDGRSWGLVILMIVLVIIIKIIGISLPSRLMGLGTMQSLSFGTMMGTRGVVALIVANAGYDAKLFTPKFFAMLVAMIIGSALVAVPLTSFFLKFCESDTQQQTHILSSTPSSLPLVPENATPTDPAEPQLISRTKGFEALESVSFSGYRVLACFNDTAFSRPIVKLGVLLSGPASFRHLYAARLLENESPMNDYAADGHIQEHVVSSVVDEAKCFPNTTLSVVCHHTEAVGKDLSLISEKVRAEMTLVGRDVDRLSQPLGNGVADEMLRRVTLPLALFVYNDIHYYERVICLLPLGPDVLANSSVVNDYMACLETANRLLRNDENMKLAFVFAVSPNLSFPSLDASQDETSRTAAILALESSIAQTVMAMKENPRVSITSAVVDSLSVLFESKVTQGLNTNKLGDLLVAPFSLSSEFRSPHSDFAIQPFLLQSSLSALLVRGGLMVSSDLRSLDTESTL